MLERDVTEQSACLPVLFSHTGSRRVLEFVAAWDLLAEHLRPVGLASGQPAEVILLALKLVLPKLQVWDGPHEKFCQKYAEKKFRGLHRWKCVGVRKLLHNATVCETRLSLIMYEPPATTDARDSLAICFAKRCGTLPGTSDLLPKGSKHGNAISELQRGVAQPSLNTAYGMTKASTRMLSGHQIGCDTKPPLIAPL